MNDFTYYNPTKIEFGKEKENNIGEYLAQSGIKKVLLHYGEGSIKKNGLYNRIIDSLNKNNIEELKNSTWFILQMQFERKENRFSEELLLFKKKLFF